MKIAALDLGSNTSLLLIAEVNGGKVQKVYKDVLTVTRLGQGVNQNRKFHPDALKRMDECLYNYQKIIFDEGVDKICAMATSAARDAKNANELFAIGKKHGIQIEVIPGDEEAKITFSGATFEYENDEGLAVIDVGGGSTEIISKQKGLLRGHSVDVGSVRLTEMFLPKHPVAETDLQKLIAHIKKEFNKVSERLPRPPVREAIAVAGTPTTLSAVVQGRPYSSELVHNSKLKLSELELWLDKLGKMTVEERQALVGMDPKRADVIVAGLAILILSARALEVDTITVSDRGVRFGVAIFAESL